MNSLCSLSSCKLCWTSLDDKRRTQKTTGWFTCADTDLLQHKTCLQNGWKISCVKPANYQDTESSDTAPTHRKWKWAVFSRVRTAPACPFPRDLHGNWALCTPFRAQCFVPLALSVCAWVCRAHRAEPTLPEPPMWATAHPSPEQDPSSFPAAVLQRQRKNPSCIILLAKVSSTAAWKAVNNSLSIMGNVLQMKRLKPPFGYKAGKCWRHSCSSKCRTKCVLFVRNSWVSALHGKCFCLCSWGRDHRGAKPAHFQKCSSGWQAVSGVLMTQLLQCTMQS